MIFIQLSEQLHKLEELLDAINDQQYQQPVEVLSYATIGQHSRHIVELIECLFKGYESGQVDYNNRVRDINLETNRLLLMSRIRKIQSSLKQPNKALKLLTDSLHESDNEKIDTCYRREVVYNTEHIIHHLALIKVALNAMNLQLVDQEFGVAYSTIQYKKEQVNA